MTTRNGRMPTAHYCAMLDVKAIIRKWQDLELTDVDALVRIRELTTLALGVLVPRP